MLPMWKKEHPFLAEAPSQTLQQTLKALAKATKEAFDKANEKRFPVFKKRGQCKNGFRCPQGFEISNNRIFLPKIGWVGSAKGQNIKGKPKNVIVSREIDHWVRIDSDGNKSVQSGTSFRESSGDRSWDKEDGCSV